MSFLTALPKINVLEVSQFDYPTRVCAAALQGLVNRQSPSLYLDYGIYDDPSARRTNENFLDDEIWYRKYRDLLGHHDQRNLDYYKKKFNLEIITTKNLKNIISDRGHLINGLVVWDDTFPDTVNIALMLAAQENLLPVTSHLMEQLDLAHFKIVHDLRNRWTSRVSLYKWAYKNLFAKSKPGYIACIEPGWQRAEFLDFIVQENIFVYSLSATSGGFASQLLLLLTFGPPRLRDLLFKLSLDRFIRAFALTWMGLKSPEVRLSNKIQRAVDAVSYPTIFGWHTKRDDELTFMLQLSSNGLRLIPSHLAGNFSFHSKLPSNHSMQEPHPRHLELDSQGIYLTFTLSDGDQLMMMHSGQLGNWYDPKRGSIPFNWETQPLLIEIAPALMDKYIETTTENDCLIAGPSGAGYIVPPLASNLDKYVQETARICTQAGIDVVTTYVADPPLRILSTLAKHKGNLQGYLAGYAVVSRDPAQLIDGVPVISNQFPKVDQIWLSAEELLTKVKEKIESCQSTPAFIGVHLFAYRTTYADVVLFVEEMMLKNEHLKIVRGDDFLELAKKHLKSIDTYRS